MVKAKKESVLAGGGERECASLVDKLKEAESAIAKRTEALGPSFVRVNDPAQIMVGNAIERASLKVREGGADVSLLNQRVGDVGMISMAEALMGNTTVTWLDISGCDVGPKGISALVPWIGKSSALQTLWLASNPLLGDKGCIALAAGLKTNTVLAKLDLTNCNVGAEGCTAVVKALQANPSLRELRLALNNYGTLSGRWIASSCVFPCSLSYGGVHPAHCGCATSPEISVVRRHPRFLYVMCHPPSASTGICLVPSKSRSMCPVTCVFATGDQGATAIAHVLKDMRNLQVRSPTLPCLLKFTGLAPMPD